MSQVYVTSYMSHRICHKFSARSMGPTEQSACVLGEIEMLIGDDACNCHPQHMSQRISYKYGRTIVKGNDGIALDMAQWICHKRHVTSSTYAPCCIHKETLHRKGDGGPEGGRCMRLHRSPSICHTMYMSQCICHKYLGKVVMRRWETKRSGYVTRYMSRCICQ